ncbi:MAG: AAA family ATPase, partial [Acidimicrobiales bacterium]
SIITGAIIAVVKPTDVFDRDAEWDSLQRFATSDLRGSALGLVYGRRRQGKTYLLEALAEATGGLYIMALQQSETQNVARFADAYQRARAAVGTAVFSGWEEAFSALLSLGAGAENPVLVVVDEFPYLLDSAPELGSVLQNLFAPRSAVVTRYRTRLILCGSALSTMRRLLAGTAPLRGRQSLELMVHPFSFRDAVRFWDVTEPELAVKLHALVGGTPAYRSMSGSAPKSVRSFDLWVASTLLDPASAMFREGRILLAEEERVREETAYLSVLAAISAGATRVSEIAAAVGRPVTSLSHTLRVLTEAQLVAPLADAIKGRRTTYRVADPMLRFHQLVIAPNEARLVHRRGSQVWSEVADTVSARIYGPHFEELARNWCEEQASKQTLGGVASKVAPTTVNCPEHRGGHELDVVVVETSAQQADKVIAIGEAKWHSSPCGMEQVRRLAHVRALLGAEAAKLLVFSRGGFTDGLRGQSGADVELVGLDRLLEGD